MPCSLGLGSWPSAEGGLGRWSAWAIVDTPFHNGQDDDPATPGPGR